MSAVVSADGPVSHEFHTSAEICLLQQQIQEVNHPHHRKIFLYFFSPVSSSFATIFTLYFLLLELQILVKENYILTLIYYFNDFVNLINIHLRHIVSNWNGI